MRNNPLVHRVYDFVLEFALKVEDGTGLPRGVSRWTLLT